LLVAFLNDDARLLLAVTLDEGTESIDELFLRHLTALVVEVGVAGVVLAVSRAAGRPTRVDRQLWREMSRRLATTATRLVDVIAVGDDAVWSMSGRRAIGDRTGRVA